MSLCFSCRYNAEDPGGKNRTYCGLRGFWPGENVADCMGYESRQESTSNRGISMTNERTTDHSKSIWVGLEGLTKGQRQAITSHFKELATPQARRALAHGMGKAMLASRGTKNKLMRQHKNACFAKGKAATNAGDGVLAADYQVVITILNKKINYNVLFAKGKIKR